MPSPAPPNVDQLKIQLGTLGLLLEMLGDDELKAHALDKIVTKREEFSLAIERVIQERENHERA